MNYTLRAVRVVAILLLSQSIFAQNATLEKETIKKIDSFSNSYHQENKTESIMFIIKNEETVYTNIKD